VPFRAQSFPLGTPRITGCRLIDEIADLGQKMIAEFHAQKPNAGRDAQISVKTIQNRGGQVRLLPEHGEQFGTIGGVEKISGQPTRRADRERERNGPDTWSDWERRVSDEVDTHSAGILAPGFGDPQYLRWVTLGRSCLVSSIFLSGYPGSHGSDSTPAAQSW